LVPLAEIAPNLTLAGRSIAKAAVRFADEPLEKWEE